MTESSSEPRIPAECALLKVRYRDSGLTVADLAAATGLSTGTVSIALSGVRYRAGAAKTTVPPDRTLVKLASVLRIDAQNLRALGRVRAADLLQEAGETSGANGTFASDTEAQAAVLGRRALARQVLAAFSDEELREELERRERQYHDAVDQEVRQEVYEDWKTSR